MTLSFLKQTPTTHVTIIDEISFEKIYTHTQIPIINVEINNTTHYFVIDTGANTNVLNESMAKTLPLTYTSSNEKILGLNGSKHSTEEVYLTMNINSHEYSDYFSILDIDPVLSRIKFESGITVSGLLGTPFLNKYYAVLHLSNNSLQLKCTT